MLTAGLRRRRPAIPPLVALLLLAFAATAIAADPAKVLRIASPDIDALDPQQYPRTIRPSAW